MATGRGIRAGAAYVELFTDDSRLIRGLRAAQGRLRAFGAAVSTIGAGLKTAGAWMTGLGLAALGGLGMAVRSFAKTGDALVEMSQRTGLSVETLSELDLAARKSGSSVEELAVGVRRMQVIITKAADGSKAAAEALAEVGLSARDLAGKGTEEQFKAVADAISRIPDASARAAAAVALFGRAGTQMLPFIKDGRAGIEALQAEARALGLTISGEAAAAAHEFSHTLETLWAAVKRAAFEVGAALGPALQDVAKWLIDAARSAAAWVREHKSLVVLALKAAVGFVAVGAALSVLGRIVSGVGGIFMVLSAAIRIVTILATTFASVLGFLLTPTGAIVAALVAVGLALAAVGGYFLYASGALGRALDWLSEKFAWLKADALAAFQGIADALASGNIGLAAQILWLTLKMWWTKGVNWLLSIWLDWKTKFLDFATDAFYGLQALWVMATSGIARVWTETVAMLKTVWTVFAAFVEQGWNWLLKTIGVRSEEEYAAAWKRIIAETDKALAGIDSAEKERLQEIAKAREAAFMDISGKAGAARRAHAASAAADLAAAEQELADARKAWEDALAAARAGRTSAATAPTAPGKMAPFDAFAGLKSSLDDIERKVGIAGSFNPMAAWGLVGVGSVQERTAKATEATAENTRTIVDELHGMNGAEFE